MAFITSLDLLNVNLHLPEDTEEMALTINGRKRKITKADFVQLGEKFKLNEKQIVNSFARFVKAEEELKKKIERSYLSLENQEKYISLLENRLMLIK